MVQGCTSWAGKSLIATALCRWYADQGLRVAPFKAQNMSTNARVVDDRRGGTGEIGVAQWLQALAARAVPDVRMNPVLVKPEAGGASQVIVLGHPDRAVSDLPWTARAPRLARHVAASFDSLAAEVDLVVCEGAGSPAEINLRSSDLANMHVARLSDAPVLLVVDIDRGGAFAHLYGTWALVDPPDQDRLAGFILNRFRGDPALLGDAPAVVTRLTRMSYAGVVPMLDHALPDEDGARDTPPASSGARVAVVRGPHASNLDEFTALARRTDLVWADDPRDLDDADLVVLPGSKDVRADVDWMCRSGMARAIQARAAAGGKILGICGGMFALGQEIVDPSGVEGGRGPWRVSGLGLLPIITRYGVDKLVAPWSGRFEENLSGSWSSLAGVDLVGYEIRYGVAFGDPPGGPASDPPRETPFSTCQCLGAGRGWVSGSVLGIAVHGAFDHPRTSRALIDADTPGSVGENLEDTFEALGAAVDTHLDTHLLARLTGGLL